MAQGKKKARRLNAWIGFLDETGFSQRPPVRATWAPKGCTPVIVEPFNWKRLSGIGLVLTDPDGRRVRWFLRLVPGSVRSEHLIKFLAQVRRHLRKRLILLWDRLPAHRSGAMRRFLRAQRHWLAVEWLPAYAPELNPLEPLWDHLDDTALANTPSEQVRAVARRVHAGMARVRRRPELGRGFLRYTGLF